jgi:hypothetical protein
VCQGKGLGHICWTSSSCGLCDYRGQRYGLCTVRSEHLVGLYGKDAYGKDSPGGTLSTEGMIMRQVDDVISVLRFDAILFFMKAEEPCLSVWVRRSKSSEQRAGAFTEEADSAEKIC